jgi:hypothetical protein
VIKIWWKEEEKTAETSIVYNLYGSWRKIEII